MAKSYYKVMYGIFGVALAAGLGLRMALKLGYTDYHTGFIAAGGDSLSFVFHIILGVGLIGLPVLNVFYRGRGEFKLEQRNMLLPVLSLVAGLALGLYVLLGLPNPLGQVNPDSSAAIANAIRYINIGLGVLSALAFVASGVFGLLRRTPPALLMPLPAIWQIVLLLSRYNGYYSVLYIADYLLAVLFMVFASLFYMGHARTICGYGRKDGRNYVIATGLGTALCGFLLAAPNYAYMLLNRRPIPLPLLSLPECCYVLFMGFYALVFVINYTGSIQKV